jgi:hypothetical protein
LSQACGRAIEKNGLISKDEESKRFQQNLREQFDEMKDLVVNTYLGPDVDNRVTSESGRVLRRTGTSSAKLKGTKSRLGANLNLGSGGLPGSKQNVVNIRNVISD